MHDKTYEFLISGVCPVIFFLFTLSGCSEDKKPGIETVSDVDIKYIDHKELEQRINTSSGRMLFVNVWATWCIPCIEEFPDLVKIHNEYKDKDFDFLSLSVDFGDNADSLVRSFMTSQQADFQVYIIKEESSDEVINLLSSEWNGAIPATIIYDKTRERKKFILGAHSYDYFKGSIDSLLLL